jgi:ArsR family transcriptional regulator, arsenate/arsenite/antimonite-responsive transcriptional repressor
MPALTSLDTTQAARWFHALSDETRLEIVERLLGGERCVCELTDLMDAAQSRLSFHLKTLKDAGLVTDRREGRWVYYTLNRETLDEIETLLGSLKRTERTAARAITCCD